MRLLPIQNKIIYLFNQYLNPSLEFLYLWYRHKYFLRTNLTTRSIMTSSIDEVVVHDKSTGKTSLPKLPKTLIERKTMSCRRKVLLKRRKKSIEDRPDREISVLDFWKKWKGLREHHVNTISNWLKRKRSRWTEIEQKIVESSLDVLSYRKIFFTL